MSLDREEIKANSEQVILSYGGKVCDWLPLMDRTQVRPRKEIVARALVMNAMMQIYFGAPIEVLDGWLYENGLEDHVSPHEGSILSRKNEDLSNEERYYFYWYIEGLWTLMWVGSLIPELPVNQSVQGTLASLAPNLQANEDGSKFELHMRIRPFPEVFKMLDLYYRSHWFTNDSLVNSYDTGSLNPYVIKERRRALEWCLQPSTSWDDVVLTV